MKIKNITFRAIGVILTSFFTLPMLAVNRTYYFKAKAVPNETAEGKVYISRTSTNSPSFSTESTTGDVWSESQNNASSCHTNWIYLYSKNESEYIFSHWNRGDDMISTLQNCSAPTQGSTNSNPSAEVFTAVFVPSTTVFGKYYRLKNASTNRYAVIANDTKVDYYYLIGTVGGGLSKIATNLNTAVPAIYKALGEKYLSVDINMIEDDDKSNVSDVLFFRPFTINKETKYNISNQGVSADSICYNAYDGNDNLQFYNNFFRLDQVDGKDYYYLTLKPNVDNTTVGGYFKDCYFYDNNGTFTLSQSKGTDETYYWYLEPVDYFCVKPLNDKIRDSEGNYWTTLTTAFPYSIPEDGGVLGAYTVSTTKTEDGKTYAELTTLAKPGETVPAGTPVLLKLSSFDAENNKLVPTGNHVMGNSSNKVTKNLLSGVYLDNKLKNNTTNYRVLNVSPSTGKIGFFKMSSSVTYMAGNKAFLDLTQTTGAKGAVYIDFDNIDSDVTGITNIHHDEEPENPVYYDLQGRRVEHPQHGIYIVNGKKVLIK